MSRTPLVLLLAAACTAPPETLDCEKEAGTIDVAVFADATTPVGSDGITLAGTASHSSGLAIRALLVGGVPAVNGGGNYLSWSATLTHSQLRLHDADGDGVASVPVTARDSCDNTDVTGAASVSLTLDPVPEVVVDRLDVTVTVPAGTAWLPADGATPALVTVTGNPAADGAVVDLSASFGDLAGASPLTLAGDGTNDATATALYTADEPGTAVFVATADGVAKTATLVVAGPPALSPDGGTLVVGSTLTVDIWTDGAVHACAAWGDTDALPVASAGGALQGYTEVSDMDGDGRAELVLTAVGESGTVDISCCDAFGQCGEATFAIAE